MADSASRFGFVAFAETWNGRLAMLGFVIGLGTELLTGQGILGQLGLGCSLIGPDQLASKPLHARGVQHFLAGPGTETCKGCP